MTNTGAPGDPQPERFALLQPDADGDEATTYGLLEPLRRAFAGRAAPSPWLNDRGDCVGADVTLIKRPCCDDLASAHYKASVRWEALIGDDAAEPRRDRGEGHLVKLREALDGGDGDVAELDLALGDDAGPDAELVPYFGPRHCTTRSRV